MTIGTASNAIIRGCLTICSPWNPNGPLNGVAAVGAGYSRGLSKGEPHYAAISGPSAIDVLLEGGRNCLLAGEGFGFLFWGYLGRHFSPSVFETPQHRINPARMSLRFEPHGVHVLTDSVAK